MGEEDKKNHSSLPSNYVTLVQLQKRWLEEKQRKQREKEDEEERKQKREKEEEEKIEREEELAANLQKIQSETITLSRRHPSPFRRDHWIQAEKRFRPIGMSVRQLEEESQFRVIVANDGELMTDNLMKNKNKSNGKNRNMMRKTGTDKDLTGGTKLLLPEKVDEVEKIPVVSTERGCGKERAMSQFRSMEIGRKCEAVSATGAKGGNGRYARGMKSRGNKREKPRADEKLVIGSGQLLPENNVEAEIIQAVATERGCGKEVVTNEFLSVEIGRKCEGGSASGGKGGNVRYAIGMKNRGNKRGILRAEEELTIRTEELFPENKVEAETIRVVSTERDSEFERNGKNLLVNVWVWKKKVVTVDHSVENLGKFKSLSVKGGKGGNERNAWNGNGGQRRYNLGSGRFNSQRLLIPRDSNFVWVRKDEGEEHF